MQKQQQLALLTCLTGPHALHFPVVLPPPPPPPTPPPPTPPPTHTPPPYPPTHPPTPHSTHTPPTHTLARDHRRRRRRAWPAPRHVGSSVVAKSQELVHLARSRRWMCTGSDRQSAHDRQLASPPGSLIARAPPTSAVASHRTSYCMHPLTACLYDLRYARWPSLRPWPTASQQYTAMPSSARRWKTAWGRGGRGAADESACSSPVHQVGEDPRGWWRQSMGWVQQGGPAAPA